MTTIILMVKSRISQRERRLPFGVERSSSALLISPYHDMYRRCKSNSVNTMNNVRLFDNWGSVQIHQNLNSKCNNRGTGKKNISRNLAAFRATTDKGNRWWIAMRTIRVTIDSVLEFFDQCLKTRKPRKMK